MTHNQDVQVERDVQPVPSSGGGSIGAKEATDVSEGHAVCSRIDQGPTEPEQPPALSPPKTEREFERAMRALGFSKRQAATIAARGFKVLAAASPAEDVSEELISLLRRTLTHFDSKDTQ